MATYIGPRVLPVLRMTVLIVAIMAINIIPPPTMEIYVPASGSRCSGSCSIEAIASGIANNITLHAKPMMVVALTAMMPIVRASPSETSRASGQ